jgi:hypothetical protein
VGAIRLFLALSVALAHLANETFPDVPRAQWLWFGLGGNWTVMMFFTVSGFLMSFVCRPDRVGYPLRILTIPLSKTFMCAPVPALPNVTPFRSCASALYAQDGQL